MSSKYFHRLLAQAFIPNPDNKPEVDHINRNRIDNSLDNLRWATRQENSRNNENQARGFIKCVWRVEHPDHLRREFKTEQEAKEYVESLI